MSPEPIGRFLKNCPTRKLKKKRNYILEIFISDTKSKKRNVFASNIRGNDPALNSIHGQFPDLPMGF